MIRRTNRNTYVSHRNKSVGAPREIPTFLTEIRNCEMVIRCSGRNTYVSHRNKSVGLRQKYLRFSQK